MKNFFRWFWLIAGIICFFGYTIIIPASLVIAGYPMSIPIGIVLGLIGVFQLVFQWKKFNNKL